jgi:hypothetical protein
MILLDSKIQQLAGEIDKMYSAVNPEMQSLMQASNIGKKQVSCTLSEALQLHAARTAV